MKDGESNGKNGGGVCIYIRSNINFQLRADLSPNNLEFLTVEITKPAQSLSWCLPGTDHHNHLLTSFQPLRELLIKLTLKTWSYILNCNLLSEVVSNNSSHLLNIIDIYGLTQLITESTRVTQYSSTLIDYCIKVIIIMYFVSSLTEMSIFRLLNLVQLQSRSIQLV